MTRLTLSLATEEAEGLARIACAELRDPRDQLRLILRAELERRGLLTTNNAELSRTADNTDMNDGTTQD